MDLKPDVLYYIQTQKSFNWNQSSNVQRQIFPQDAVYKPQENIFRPQESLYKPQPEFQYKPPENLYKPPENIYKPQETLYKASPQDNQYRYSSQQQQVQPVVQPYAPPFQSNPPVMQTQNQSNSQKKLSLNAPKVQIPASEASINVLDVINKQNNLVELESIEEEVQNALTFHLNNLSANNVNEKAVDLRKILESRENAQKWLARTLIFKRVISETLTKNNYLQLLNLLQLKLLNKQILKETYSCIQKLLALQTSNNEKASMQTKSFLKNMGFWLGQITLSRNKPIILKYLNLKQLITEAFNTPRFSIIIPFICKILEGTRNSEVFVITNPWFKGILQVINEIYSREDVKITIKQEIKLLFKNLEIDIKQLQQLQASDSFNSFPNPETQEIQGPPFMDLVKIPNKIQAKYANQLPINLKEMAARAIEKALNEVISPVLARTVTIALYTGRKLVQKDFALEPSDQKFLQGSSLIVQNLANSLALATSRDPLQTSIHSAIIKELEPLGLGLGEKDIDDIASGITEENLDLGCQIIQKKVVEKAIYETSQDPELREGVERRKEGIYRPDENFMKALEILPMNLKPDMKGLNDDEMDIYEDFSEPQKRRKEDTGKNMTFWQNFPQNLEYLFEETEIDINNILNSYREFLNNGQFSENALINIALKFLETYFKVRNPAQKLEILLKYVQSFMSFLNLSKSLPKAIKEFLLNLPDNALSDHNRFNETFLILMFTLELINEKSLDKICGSLLKKPNNLNIQISVVKTLSHLIFVTKQLNPNNCLLSCVSLGSLGTSNELVVKFLENLNKFSSFSVRMNKKAELLDFLEKKSQLHERIYDLFQKYLILFFKKGQKAPHNEMYQAFENVFYRESEEISLKSLAILIDLAVMHANNSLLNVKKMDISDIDNSLIDALSMLISNIFYRSNEKLKFFELILDAFESTLNYSHRQETNFNQRPFLRFLTNMIENIAQTQEKQEVFFLIVKKMIEISPLKFPGFLVSWVELLGNHLMIPEILRQEELQYSYHLLIAELMKFFKKVINEEDVKKSHAFKCVYIATLKIMLILLHDFPEFLIFYAFNFCNDIPESFVQIRNIVLAAFPKNMRLIDPFQINDVFSIFYLNPIKMIISHDFSFIFILFISRKIKKILILLKNRSQK